MADAEIDAALGRWCKEASRRYLELLAEADTSDRRSPDGTAEMLVQIEHKALLTGNPEPVARARMEKLGLAELFPPGQGAFGCDAEDRADLIAIARKRAGDWPREQTVAVGDTEADVRGARRAGIRVIGFGPDPALAEADAVVHSMSDLPRALAALS
jgi:phosphoglycolate phosphatase-like HAD superfamily hydrolase